MQKSNEAQSGDSEVNIEELKQVCKDVAVVVQNYS